MRGCLQQQVTETICLLMLYYGHRTERCFLSERAECPPVWLDPPTCLPLLPLLRTNAKQRGCQPQSASECAPMLIPGAAS